MKTTFISVKSASKMGDLNQALQRLRGSAIFVGIAKGVEGDKREDGAISNSDLGFIHEFGAPASNIPARPFLRPGVESARKKVAAGMGAAIKAALHDDEALMDAALEQTGLNAATAVKDYMTKAPFAPLSPATLRQRNRSRMTKGKRDNELEGTNVRPLINTGALLNSIEHYIEEA